MPSIATRIPILAALVAASIAGSGCASPSGATNEVDEGTVGRAVSSFSTTENCPTITGDVYHCTNKRVDLVNRDSFPLFYDLDAWGNELVEVKNTSEVRIVVYVAQGFNKKDYFTMLRPGESIVMERLDPVAPLYHVLFYPEVDGAPRGSVSVDARPFWPG